MKRYKNAKEWRLYIEFETNHTTWTNTKPLTGKIFLCTIFRRINEAFWERLHCQLLETFWEWQVCVKIMHPFKGLYLEKIVFIICVFFFHICWRGKWYQIWDDQLLYSRENGVRWDIILYRKSMGSVLVVLSPSDETTSTRCQVLSKLWWHPLSSTISREGGGHSYWKVVGVHLLSSRTPFSGHFSALETHHFKPFFSSRDSSALY